MVKLVISYSGEDHSAVFEDVTRGSGVFGSRRSAPHEFKYGLSSNKRERQQLPIIKSPRDPLYFFGLRNKPHYYDYHREFNQFNEAINTENSAESNWIKRLQYAGIDLSKIRVQELREQIDSNNTPSELHRVNLEQLLMPGLINQGLTVTSKDVVHQENQSSPEAEKQNRFKASLPRERPTAEHYKLLINDHIRYKKLDSNYTSSELVKAEITMMQNIVNFLDNSKNKKWLSNNIEKVVALYHAVCIADDQPELSNIFLTKDELVKFSSVDIKKVIKTLEQESKPRIHIR